MATGWPWVKGLLSSFDLCITLTFEVNTKMKRTVTVMDVIPLHFSISRARSPDLGKTWIVFVCSFFFSQDFQPKNWMPPHAEVSLASLRSSILFRTFMSMRLISSQFSAWPLVPPFTLCCKIRTLDIAAEPFPKLLRLAGRSHAPSASEWRYTSYWGSWKNRPVNQVKQLSMGHCHVNLFWLKGFCSCKCFERQGIRCNRESTRAVTGAKMVILELLQLLRVVLESEGQGRELSQSISS